MPPACPPLRADGRRGPANARGDPPPRATVPAQRPQHHRPHRLRPVLALGAVATANASGKIRSHRHLRASPAIHTVSSSPLNHAESIRLLICSLLEEERRIDGRVSNSLPSAFIILIQVRAASRGLGRPTPARRAPAKVFCHLKKSLILHFYSFRQTTTWLLVRRDLGFSCYTREAARWEFVGELDSTHRGDVQPGDDRI